MVLNGTVSIAGKNTGMKYSKSWGVNNGTEIRNNKRMDSMDAEGI
jgi:hypothetical protein